MTFNVILFFFTYISLASSETIIVNTNIGPIKGSTSQVNQQTVYVFTSIKYAKPPLGPLRFKKPEPYTWTGTLDATKEGPLCWQPDMFPGLQPAKIPEKDMSEDCLLMNIWTSSLNKESRMPVMIWIHGGGYHVGGINSVYRSLTDGSWLATQGVVVVAINFRLHNLGLLFLNNSDAPGNVGLLDQVMAFKWIRDNIEAFGGDPRRVTLLGESSGSNSVGFHLVSPLSKGLFQRAILQSGSPYSHGHKPNAAEQLKKGQQLIDSMGCRKDVENFFGGLFGKKKVTNIECLRNIEPKKLMAASNVPHPVIGSGEFIPLVPRTAITSNRFNSVYEIMTGVNDDEGSLFTNKILESKLIGKGKNSIKFFLFLSKVFLPYEGIDTDKLYDKYFGHLTDKEWQDQNLVKQQITKIVSDNMFNCPKLAFATDYAKQPNTSVYFYTLSHKANDFAKLMMCEERWQGSCHAQDIPFQFGSPLFVRGNWSEEDRTVARLFVYYWTNFAKTGNPVAMEPSEELKSRVKGLEKWPNVSWPKYQPKLGHKLKVMKLNPKQVELVEDPWEKTCQGFWNFYLDKN